MMKYIPLSWSALMSSNCISSMRLVAVAVGISERGECIIDQNMIKYRCIYSLILYCITVSRTKHLSGVLCIYLFIVYKLSIIVANDPD